MLDYKNTLNLPDTKFPMRGNLVNREPITLQHWCKQNLYKIIRHAKKGKKIFTLHDGPPYANGGIHIGHSVNKILKDIIIKHKGLMGYDAPYVPGWDCHGLPIELKVEKLIGKPDEKVSSAEFRRACRLYATKQIEKQKKDFIRLGVLGDWEHPYLTMSFVSEANIIRTFGKIIANGHLYRGAKPVHWCIHCRSALAEAEVEYYNRVSNSIDVAFEAVDSSAVIAKFGNSEFIGTVSLLIWTTTPWSLPANRAIAVHPDFDYQLITVNEKGYILAASRLMSVMERFGITRWSVIGTTKGKTLEFLRFRHIFMEFDVPVILAKYVTLDAGTGAVHIAPAHGSEDFSVSEQYGLEIINTVGPDGCYVSGTFPELDGLQVFKANETIISLLRKGGSLLCVEKLQHSYPHCWRHKTPIIFCTTPQWFVSMEKQGLRKKMLSEIKKVQWIPAWGQARIESMITNRPDWCISRQRTWGVPMTLFVHNETGMLHPRTAELIETVAQQVEKNGIQAWWDLNIADVLGDDVAYYHKILDTLDVWFDSGSTHSSVMAIRSGCEGEYVSDMYLEGSDQHRGWFMSSLMTASAIYGKAPYRQVLTHGFTVDQLGLKMSKSMGNVIRPQQVIKKFGADILRLWVASTDYSGEMTISDQILKRSSDSYRRIRNTARFLLANLSGFNPQCHCVSPEDMVVLDRWAVGQAKIVQAEIIDAYEKYNFHNAVQRIMRFCSVEMGSFYLEIIKDRQYVSKKNSIAHRSCQTALYHIIEALVRWISPIMSFTSNEIWGFIPGNRAQYVFTEEWYDGLFGLDTTQPLNNLYWKTLLQVRSEINKVVAQARSDNRIKGSLEACITLYAENNLAKLMRQLGNELYFALLTSGAVVEDYANANSNAIKCANLKGLKIVLEKADGEKCPRCWHYKMDIGKHPDYPEICGRCYTNIAGSGEERKFV